MRVSLYSEPNKYDTTVINNNHMILGPPNSINCYLELLINFKATIMVSNETIIKSEFLYPVIILLNNYFIFNITNFIHAIH